MNFVSVRSAIRAHGACGAMLALAAVCLAPALATGYWAEDIYYSAMVPASPILRQSSWLVEAWLGVKHSVLLGRFYPITPIITAAAFRVFPQVMEYKAYIIGVTLLDLALFHAFVRRLTGCPRAATLALACTIPLIQFRLTVDPMLGYYAQIQWVIASFFLSLIGLIRTLERPSRGALALSGLAYLGCTLAYELTYPLVLIPLWLIVQARPGWRRGFMLAAPFVAAAGGSAGMTLVVRWLYPSSNYVHTTDWNLLKVSEALLWQVSAGLPLSYYLADPLHLFATGPNWGDWWAWALRPGVLVVFGIGWAVNFATLGRVRANEPPNDPARQGWTVAGVGVLLATLPALLTGISPYHRNYLGPGVGWIGVMIQYYGVGLLLTLALQLLVIQRSQAGAALACWVGSTLLALILALTYRANSEVATAINAPAGSRLYRQFAADHGTAWHWQRLNLIEAIAAGVMDGVPDGSRVELDHQYPLWHDTLYGQFFYSKETGRRIETAPTVLPTRLPPDAPRFRVADLIRDRQIGLVSVVPSAGSRGEGRLFVRHPSLGATGIAAADGSVVRLSTPTPTGATPERSPSLRLGRDLPVLRRGPGWALLALGAGQPEIDLSSLRVEVATFQTTNNNATPTRR